MATSTAALIQSDIVSAITAIAVSQLGFTSGHTNIQSKLLEEAEQIDGFKAAAYLSAGQVSGQVRLRALGVRVTSNDDPYAMKALVRTLYSIKVRYYYHPADIDSMISHRRKVTQAIFTTLGFNLGGRVDWIRRMTGSEFPLLARRDMSSRFVWMDTDLLAEKVNAD